ncbi:MAG: hypothetical protein PHQ80_03740 [Candidatus ainarchaeum sp.]|nr:hypothetical protein [Candidatus ainarchaeum sp.]MDD5096220.1 hypothetical protein [Candidatus ainarchaeum sp.]
MRGYVSFLIVLAALGVFVAAAALLAEPHYYSNEKAISVMRMEHIERNVKENILQATSYGMRAGADAYDLAVPPEMRVPQEREVAVRAAAYASLAQLGADLWDEDYEVQVWCGYAASGELDALPGRMRDAGGVRMCAACQSIASPACAPFIQINQVAPYGAGLEDSIQLKGPEPPNPILGGVVGISVYSSKYDVAGVSVFPTGEVIR